MSIFGNIWPILAILGQTINLRLKTTVGFDFLCQKTPMCTYMGVGRAVATVATVAMATLFSGIPWPEYLLATLIFGPKI